MFTTKIINIEVSHSQADDKNFIDVEVEVYREKDGEKQKVEIRKFGYPIGTTKETIQSSLEKLCETLASDEVIGQQSAELNQQLKDVEKLKDELIEK